MTNTLSQLLEIGQSRYYLLDHSSHDFQMLRLGLLSNALEALKLENLNQQRQLILILIFWKRFGRGHV